MSERFDAIVVGAGQNGLAAAVRLATRRRRVLVLERRDQVGGLCTREEFHPGFSVPGVLHDDGRVHPATVAALGLSRQGLELRSAPPLLLAEPGGAGVVLDPDPARAAAAIEQRSPRDAAAYLALHAFLRRLAPLVGRMMSTPPPPIAPVGAAEWWDVVRQGLGLWKLGRADTLELLRIAPMCVADFLNERFESPLLVEGLAAPAVTGTWAGPWSAGTTTNLLLAACAPGRRVAGGPPALIAALAAAAQTAGVELRTGSDVARIEVDGNSTRGVTLASGETLAAPVVLATCDPRRTFLDLVAPGTLPLAFEEEVGRIRSRGTSAQLRLALSGPLELAGHPGESHEEIRLGGGHVDDLERAFDAIKYRRFSERPHLEIRVPSLSDPSLAPAGGAVVSILASFAPSQLEGGWTAASRRAFTEAALSRLEAAAPGTRSRIVAQELLTPDDIAARFGVTGGQIHHVEPALDQLFVLRPSASTARFSTPVAGLFLGGSGSHGGGGVTATAGLLAADAVLSRRS